MALLAKKDTPVAPVHRLQAFDEELGAVARTVPQSRGPNSTTMERVAALLSDGLMHNHEDGAKMLQRAVDEAEDETKRLEAEMATLKDEMNRFKQGAATHILGLKSKFEELRLQVQTRNQHLSQMARWVEEQEKTLQTPPVRPTLTLEAPDDHHDETPD
jgi:hypothetical protein